MENNTLTHWGVKGMRWGVRRYQNADGSLTPAGKKRYSEGLKGSSTANSVHDDYQKAHGPKSVKSMSDDELRKRLNRLQMEKNYKDLNPGKVAAGKKVISGIIKTGATVASVTGTALTIYNNFDKIKGIVQK